MDDTQAGWLDELERLNAIALTWYRVSQTPRPTTTQPGVTVTLPGGATGTATASPIVILALVGAVVVALLVWG